MLRLAIYFAVLIAIVGALRFDLWAEAQTNLVAIHELRAVWNKAPLAADTGDVDMTFQEPASILRIRGTAELLLGNVTGALPLLTLGASRQPSNQMTDFWLAKARNSAGLDATEEYRAAGALPYMISMATQAGARSDCASMDYYATLASKISPRSAIAFFLVAQAKECEGHNFDAIAEYRVATNLVDANTWLGSVIEGDLARLEHKDTEAISAYSRAIRIEPTGGSIQLYAALPYGRLTDLYRSICANDQSQKILSDGLLRFPNDQWLLSKHTQPLKSGCH